MFWPRHPACPSGRSWRSEQAAVPWVSWVTLSALPRGKKTHPPHGTPAGKTARASKAHANPGACPAPAAGPFFPHPLSNRKENCPPAGRRPHNECNRAFPLGAVGHPPGHREDFPSPPRLLISIRLFWGGNESRAGQPVRLFFYPENGVSCRGCNAGREASEAGLSILKVILFFSPARSVSFAPARNSFRIPLRPAGRLFFLSVEEF